MKKLFTVQGQEVRVEYSSSEPMMLLWSTTREDGDYSFIERFPSITEAHQQFQDSTYSRAKEIYQVLEPTKIADTDLAP